MRVVQLYHLQKLTLFANHYFNRQISKMSVENLEVIDVVHTDKNDNVVLTISDHLEWDKNNEHLITLQNKINYYLGTIEGGTLQEKYPDAKNRHIIINVVAQYPPHKVGEVFLERTKKILESAGYGFSFSVFVEKINPLLSLVCF